MIRGDSGLISNLELISPAFSLLDAFDAFDAFDASINDNWNALVFYDAAVMRISEAFPVEVGQSLQSVGVGLNCSFGDHGYACASYGREVASHGLFAVKDGG